jgi:hypothetical protein
VGVVPRPPEPQVEYQVPDINAFIAALKVELAEFAKSRNYIMVLNKFRFATLSFSLHIAVDCNGKPNESLRAAATQAGFQLGWGLDDEHRTGWFVADVGPIDIHITPERAWAMVSARGRNGFLETVEEEIWKRRTKTGRASAA